MRILDHIRLRGKPLYEFGTVSNGTPARRNRLTGEVQFVLWKAGEQGHAEDYWHEFGDGWETTFKPNTEYAGQPVKEN